jgi:hypothetical protein
MPRRSGSNESASPRVVSLDSPKDCRPMPMRNALWFVVFLALPSSSAFARDSLWLLCTGTGIETINPDKTHSTTTRHGIAVSLFDVRYKAVQRLDSIDLQFGGRRFTAEILNFDMVFNKKTRPATLELKEGTRTMFVGQIHVSLAESGSTLSLNGKLRRAFDASQELVPFEANLACKDMSEFGDD